MTTRAEELLHQKHRIDPMQVKALGSAEINEIRAIARGEQKSPYRIRAIDILVVTATPEVPKILGEILNRRKEDVMMRASVALCLGRVGGPGAEEILQNSAAQTDNPLILTKIASSLGRVGTERSIKKLQEITKSPVDYLQKQANFALILIAHRIGLTDFKPPRPAEAQFLPPTPDMVSLTIADAGPKVMQNVATDVATENYGVNVLRSVGFGFKCESKDLIFALDADRAEMGLTRSVLERPSVVGLVAQRSPEDGSYSVARLVLTGPTRQENQNFYVAVYRTDGTLVHYGMGQARDKSAEAELKSIDLKGNASIDIKVSVRDSQITFVRLRMGLVAPGKATPMKFDPSSLR